MIETGPPMLEPVEHIGKRIKRRRAFKGLSQATLGAAAGVTGSAVSAWEREEAEPVASHVRPLSKVLGCNTDWLLTGEGNPDFPGMNERHCALITSFEALTPGQQTSLMQFIASLSGA